MSVKYCCRIYPFILFFVTNNEFYSNIWNSHALVNFDTYSSWTVKKDKGKGKYGNSAGRGSFSFKQREVTNRGSLLCFDQKETSLHQAERSFLISMERIAELGGKLGYLVIMSRSERDNKSSRMQATLSRSDHRLVRIRTNWILMRDVLVQCKKLYWKASKMPLNSNFFNNWEIELQTAICR